MRTNLMNFLRFLLFLFTAEDSIQGCGGPNIHAANNGAANKVKCLFWLSLSIAFSLVFSQLH